MRIAIYDLGSTSFNLLVADVRDDAVHRILRRRETLHLAAAAAANDGHIPHDCAFRALRAAKSLRKDASRLRPDAVIATATSALRDAANGDHTIERLEIVLRTPVRVLDGNEEAALAFRGATAGLAIGDECVLVADLGGGSLDIAIGRPGSITTTATFPLGASRMTALHVRHDPPTPSELEAIEAAVTTSCAALFDQVLATPPMRLLVAGGTGRAVARIATNTDDVDGVIIPAARLHALTRRLTTMSRVERNAMPQAQARRVGVLPAGALILSTLVEGIEAGSMTVSESGLREGLLLDLLAGLDRAQVPIAR